MSRPLARDVITDLLMQCGCIVREGADGTIGIVTLDTPGSVTRNIDQTEVLINEMRIPRWEVSHGPAENLITELNIWYRPILPQTQGGSGPRTQGAMGGYAAHIYCKRNDGSSSLYNFSSGGSTYSGYLDNAYGIIATDRPMTVKLPGIRDAATAEALAKLLIGWRCELLSQLVLTCTYSVLDIELGDKVGCTATFLPSYLESKKWLVVGQRIVPNVGVGVQPEVTLTLLEMP